MLFLSVYRVYSLDDRFEVVMCFLECFMGFSRGNVRRVVVNNRGRLLVLASNHQDALLSLSMVERRRLHMIRPLGFDLVEQTHFELW